MRKIIKVRFNWFTFSYQFIDGTIINKKYKLKGGFFPRWWILNFQTTPPRPVKFRIQKKYLDWKYDLISEVSDSSNIFYNHKPSFATVSNDNIQYTVAFHQYESASFLMNEKQIGSIEKIVYKKLFYIDFRIQYLDSLELSTVKQLSEIFLLITRKINTQSGLSQFSKGMSGNEELVAKDRYWFSEE